MTASVTMHGDALPPSAGTGTSAHSALIAAVPQLRDGSAFAQCLPSLLAALNWRGTPRQISDALPYGAESLDRIDFLNTLANLGYGTQQASIRMDRLDRRLLPCLFIPDSPSGQLNPVAVLLAADSATDDRTLSAFCPTEGKALEIAGDLKIRGTAYLFTPKRGDTAAEAAAIPAASGQTWFRSILRRFHRLFVQIFAISIAINIIGLATPLFVVAVYDKAIGSHSPELLYYLLVGIAMAIATESAFRLLRLRAICWLGARIDNVVGNAIFERLLYLPASFTERSSTAAQLARLRSFDSVREFFSGPLFLVILEMPFVLVLIAAIAALGGPLALIPALMAGGFILILLAMRPTLRGAIYGAAKAHSDKQRLTLETFVKIAALRQNGMLGQWYQRLREHSGKTSFASFRSSFLAARIEVLAHALCALTAVATLSFGVGRIWNGEMTVGALIATMILVWRTLSPLQAACAALPRLEQLVSSIAQINRLIEIKPERDSHANPPAVQKLKGAIAFSNVGLRYSRDVDPVFAGLSFEIKPGELVAIAGGNGSGKSTTLKLINRLYSPQAGNIRIDGIDIRQADPIELRRHIAYVPENPDLFEGTISENLRFANPIATQRDLESALVRAGAWQDVQALPQGLETPIGGSNKDAISADLTYQLALARADLVDGPIMLLDQPPFSLLNSKRGAAYRDFLKESRGRRTTLFITHRADYLRMADKVIVLRSDGRPIIGSPENVLERYAA